MTFTYEPTTDAGRVRLIINDRDAANAIFDDAEIDAFLAMNDGVKRAAAAALDTIASNQAMVLKVIRLLDLSTDGAQTARALRDHATVLRVEAIAEDAENGDLFDYAELSLNAFTRRERVEKQFQRGEA